MRDRDLHGPDDYLRKAEEALQVKDDYERAARLGDLLDWAIEDRRRAGDASGDYGRVIAVLQARVGRAIERLRVLVQGADNPPRPTIDLQALVRRLEAIRRAGPEPE